MMAVLLGLPDDYLPPDVTTAWDVSKIGSKPSWMQVSTAPKCDLCQQTLVFIGQIYCPLANSSYHRVLYIFACGNKSCYNKAEGWVVLRNQCQAASDKVEEEKPLFEDDWGIDSGDWGDDSGDVTSKTKVNADDWGSDNVCDESEKIHNESSDISSVDTLAEAEEGLNAMAIEDDVEAGNEEVSAEDMDLKPTDSILYSVSSKVEQSDDNSIVNECSNQSTVPELPGFYISVIDEPDKVNLRHEEKLMREYSRREGVDLNQLAEDFDERQSGKGAEGYEKAQAKHGDKIFEKFSKRMTLCPQQILRYSFEGKPLPLAPLTPQQATHCPQCGHPRVFELQLLPTLVNFLKAPDSEEPAVEFGTVMIYTCGKSCWSDDWAHVQEGVVVQPDPYQGLLK